LSKKLKLLERIFNIIFIQTTISQDYWLPSRSKILNHPYLKDLDIINLHNVHGGYFSYPLIKKLSMIAPIVLTFHDMWYLTGHCCNSYDCDNWKTGCITCPHPDLYPKISYDNAHFHWKQKKDIYKQSRLKVVTCPSKWMQNKIKESPLFENIKVCQIFNSIDTDTLRPIDKIIIREVLDLPKGKNIICFGASNISDPGKGFNLFLESLSKDFIVNNDIFLVVMGSDPRNNISNIPDYLPYKYFGFINNDIFKSLVYNSADVFIFPTQADNMPNMLVETMSCGVAPITFDVGGCGEIVVNGQTGYLAVKNDYRDFNNGISTILHDEQLRKRLSENCRKFALENFTFKVCAEKYSQVYKEAINNK
jgi:glycosyltransferase involved in cell wall biosynthesis